MADPHAIEVDTTAAIIRGSAHLLVAIKLAQRGMNPQTPEKLIWSKPFGIGQRPDAARRAYEAHSMAIAAERQRIADENRVRRDPCPMCGTRADYGCRHQRVAA